MKYCKPPLNIKDQIQLLRQRGMEMPDPDRASSYLSHISYFRLREYWIPCQRPLLNQRFRRGLLGEELKNGSKDKKP